MNKHASLTFVGADFWDVDEDNNKTVFRVRRFTEWPGNLH